MLGKLRPVCLDKFIHSINNQQGIAGLFPATFLAKSRYFIKLCLTLCVCWYIFTKTSVSPLLRCQLIRVGHHNGLHCQMAGQGYTSNILDKGDYRYVCNVLVDLQSAFSTDDGGFIG